jgi:ABC-type sugar transport system ATPase subunit
MSTTVAHRPVESETAPLYQVAEASMFYGGVRALDGVSFSARPGEVHALLGANGAGKSTLVKILAGVLRPSQGRLRIAGRDVEFRSQRDAVAKGIATVSQELNLFPDLSVLENLFVMSEQRWPGLRRSEMEVRGRQVLSTVGLNDVPTYTPVRSLSLAGQQLVEIGRALLAAPKVLILDEPTSALQAAETQRFLDLVREMRRQNVAVVFVSHFLEDVFDIADVITVLRDGRIVEDATPCARLTSRTVVEAMVGSAGTTAAAQSDRRALPIPPVAGTLGPLVIDDLVTPGIRAAVSLKADPGEVVGLAGLEGSGASEVLQTVFGHRQLTSGAIRLPSGGRAPGRKNRAVNAGVAYVPADRKTHGLILGDPVYDSVTMVTAGPLRRLGFLPKRRVKIDVAERWRNAVGIVMASPTIVTQALSGGNQQKVVFAKWMETRPSVVLLDDPTRGVDVAAKADMMRLVRAVAQSGRVVMYTSSDLEEMAAVCDRVIVFYRGAIVGEIRPPLTEDQLLEAITTGRTAPILAHARVDSEGSETDTHPDSSR